MHFSSNNSFSQMQNMQVNRNSSKAFKSSSFRAKKAFKKTRPDANLRG